MGKRLQTPFSDVNQRIIKRTKKDKIKYGKEISQKRKSTTDIEEPSNKKSKTVSEEDNWHQKQLDEISKETVYVEVLDNSTNTVLKTREHVSYDLFLNDERKNNYSTLTSKDIYLHVIDEVALEGLDGITLEAFWKRMLVNFENTLHVDKNIQNFIWRNMIVSQKHFNFFELPVARGELEIYNPFDYMHTEIGVVLELAYELPDIYPIAPVINPDVLGSCSTFYDRIDISETVQNLSIEEAEEKYGRKLAIVANQNVRTAALCGELVDPCMEFINMEYCILERVGRSRRLGDLTQGNMSIASAFKMDSKSVFHYKKQLYQNHLISKQFFIIKSAILDSNKTGSLLHLTRFYSNIRSRQSCMADQIINVLRSQPGYRMESKSLRKIFADNIASVGKLMKNLEFRKFVKPKVFPYRTIYPNAEHWEYENKCTKLEKNVVCYELINPYVNVSAYWRDKNNEDSDGEDEKDEELSGKKMFKSDALRDIYYHIHSMGDKGCSVKEIRSKIGLDKNSTRVALNRLLGKALVDFKKYDDGKQRKYIYKIKCWKKPDDQPTPGTSSSPTPDIKISSIKTRMIERQRAALAKKRQENLNEPKEIRPVTNINNDNFLKLNIPHILDWTFLIENNIEQVISKISPILMKINLNRHHNINLTYIMLNIEQKFQINDILNEVKACLPTHETRMNFNDFYVRKYKFDHKTKYLLFKVATGETKVKEDLLQNKSEDSVRTPVPNLAQQPTLQNRQSEKPQLDFMGPNPLIVFQDEERTVKTEIVLSTPPSQYQFNTIYPKDKVFTERVHNRLQKILDLINEMQIIEDRTIIIKYIIEKEAESGYDKKIDRKSLLRLLKRLVDEGYIKIFKFNLNNSIISKSLIYVCHPSVTHTHDTLKTACEQLKWKYFLSVAKKMTKPHIPAIQKSIQDKFASSPFSQNDVLNSIDEMKQLGKTMMKEIKMKFNTRVGKIYGVKPKFTRMRIIHEFLFFLIYEYNGSDNPLHTEEIEKVFKNYRIVLSESDLQELPKLYRGEISWKMFVPPLPVHTGWPRGWALMCDIILRFPVCVLLKLHNCSYEDPTLIEILNHPIKRFYLVRDLPEKTRKTILFKRKYLFSVYDTINRLVFCGLVQFGPQRFKEKDQVFIYLNQKASILDTTSSAPAYNEIEVKEYPKLTYNFNTHADVERYWQDLSSISLNTKLNIREPGKLVTLVYINSKPELVDCIKSRTPNEVALYDDGSIPGDGKGAAGLDSSLWPHLIRNWFHTDASVGNSLYTELKQDTLKEITMKIQSFKELHLNTTKFYLPTVSKTKSAKKVKKITTHKKRRKGTIKRTIQIRKTVAKKREYSDAIDKNILKKMSGSRSRWSKNEEEMIYLCKVADTFFNKTNVYRRMVPFTVIRDVIHRLSPESRFKTSKAIQRRSLRLQKTSSIALDEHVTNLLKIKAIKDTFGLLINKTGTRDKKEGKVFKLTEKQIIAAYVILVYYVLKNKKIVKDVLHGNLVNIDHLSEENIQYTEEHLQDPSKKHKYKDASSQDDIRRDVIKGIIHSSLCSKDDEVNITTRLLKIYQNYSDGLLREAVKELKNSNTITCRRWKERKHKIWETPFALSQYYIFFQYSTFSSVTASEAYNTFLSITRDGKKDFQSNEAMERNNRYGQLLAVNEFCSYYSKMNFVFNFPQNTVTLNPNIQADDLENLVTELALRYQLKLNTLQQETNENEIDLEEGSENFRSKNNQELEEDKLASESTDKVQTVSTDLPDTQTNPLDLTVDSGNYETINRLKTWITDRVQTNIERRSPSPEFMTRQTETSDGGKFFETSGKFISNEDINNEKINVVAGSEKTPGQVPTLEEIKAGMLKVYTNNEERGIPHITELSDLLKENFNDLKTNADLETLKSHFLTEYASLNKITVDELEELQNHYLVEYITDTVKNKRIWDKIENDIFIKSFPLMPDYETLIRQNGGNHEDIELATEILQFTLEKTFFGATGQELKANFSHREKTCSLLSLIKNLITAGLIFQTGICGITFVHYSYQYIWIVDQNVDDSISREEEESTRSQKICSIKIMPWVRVNGTLNKPTIIIWISNVLSYCLDYPKVQFSKMCERFCYIKPVDLYFIVQILEELGCLEVFVYETEEEHLFSKWTMPKQRYATILDNLEEMIIQPNNVSMTCLGSFFYENTVNC